MKLLYISGFRLFKTDDNRFWSSTSFPVDFMLRNFPEISHWAFWGRIKQVDDSSSLYLLPDKVNSCSISYSGPKVKRESRLLWPLLIIRSFRRLRAEINMADIVFLKMPSVFSCIAFYLLRKDHITISQQVGDPAETIPLMIPNLKLLGPIMAKYCKKVASRVDKAFFISNALRSIYGDAERGDMISNESRVTRDMIIKKPNITPHCPARIVYVGRLTAEKGLKILLRSIAEVKKDIAVELWIIGEGTLKNHLKSLAEMLGIADNIKWFGSLRWGPQLFEKVSEADTLALPSYSEGLGLVIIEGMGQGLVVVGSSVGGIPEVLDNGRCGILVPPGNAMELAKAIKLSVTDIKLRRSLIEKGLAQAKKHCLESQAGLLIGEIRRLIETKGGI